ncbi:MAG: AEC family transporter [Pseudomonadota bacterium]
MEALLDPLQYAILPIFAVPAIGFVMGLRGTFSAEAARGTNQFVIAVALPALMFALMSRTRFDEVDWPVLIAYIGSNLTLYAVGYVFFRFGFGLRRREAVLLGFTGALPNHVFFILPIIESLYGAEAARAVVLMIPFDVVIMFAGTSLIMEALAGDRTPAQTLGAIIRNPLLIAIAAGGAVAGFSIDLHDGLERFLTFTGAAAAPASLFALGVMLSQSDLSRIGGPAWTATVIKVFVHPLIAIILFAETVPVSPAWEAASILVFAAPSGAMAFVLAVKYDVPVDSIAKAIILSTALSVFTIAALA